MKTLKLIIELEVDEGVDEQEFIDRTYYALEKKNDEFQKIKDVDLYE